MVTFYNSTNNTKKVVEKQIELKFQNHPGVRMLYEYNKTRTIYYNMIIEYRDFELIDFRGLRGLVAQYVQFF